MPVFTRPMMEGELKALLAAQKDHHPKLVDDTCARLSERVFAEAEPVPPEIGKCRYGLTDASGEVERRMPRGSDLFQRKRIFEEVNNLRVISARTAAERPLTVSERDGLAERLLAGEDLTAAAARTALKLGKGALAEQTSLDVRDTRQGRKSAGELHGHPLAAAMGKADALEQWQGFDEATRERIAQLVRGEDEVDALHRELAALGLDEAAQNALSDARLPATHSAAGETATRRLLAELEKDVISNFDAEQRAGLEPLDPKPPKLDQLPYYGEILKSSCVAVKGATQGGPEAEFGRIPNPVVHVALNQIRKTANAYLALYGKPRRTCIELARDMNKSAEEREKTEKEIDKNRRKNEQYLETMGVHARRLGPNDLTRMKLRHMQGGECLYTGKCICIAHMFDGSVEVDHILPRAETRDDGIANLALVFKEPNQFKGKRPPFEAFHPAYQGQNYAAILKRARKRGKGVYWRFKENAMDRFRDKEGFRARFLGDTRYIAKMARRYLTTVCVDPNGVVSLNGRITSALRYEWGLHDLIRQLMVEDGRLTEADVKPAKGGETLTELKARRGRTKKIRWDHRHHLLDAIVAACVTRNDVQRLQTLAGRQEDNRRSAEILADVRRADPQFKNAGFCWQEGFREKVKAFLEGKGRGEDTDKPPVSAVVHKADHAVAGQLHMETNYGVICSVAGKPGQYVVRSHVMLNGLSPEQVSEIGVPTTALANVEAAMAAGAPIRWGGADPLTALKNNLATELDRMRDDLLQLMPETPAEHMEKVKSDGGRQKARAEWAVEEYTRRTGRRRYTKIETLSVRILKGAADHRSKPRRVNATKGNDRLVYFINAEGERDLEVVSTLDANTQGFRERWRREGGRVLFVLRKDDLVEMFVDPNDPASTRRIFRTVSFSPTQTAADLEFLPVEEDRAPKEVPPDVRKRITSLGVFRKHAPVMVVLDPTGRVRWRGPAMN